MEATEMESKTVWAPCIKKEFCDAIGSTKLMNKSVIAVQRNDG